MSDRTFSILKPNVVAGNNVGEILQIIERAGFRIVALKKLQLSRQNAEDFYREHEGKEFFERLVKFMTEGPVIPLILEKNNAIEDFRTLIGSTNPENAAEGTIRKKFATSVTINAIHGSDSPQSAERESNFFFSKLEQF